MLIYIYIDSNFSCSDHNHILNVKDNTVNIRFLKYYLQINIQLLESGFKGATIKNLSKSHIENLEIPIPSLQVQNQIVERLDVLSENNQTLEKNIVEFKKIMKYYVDIHTMDGKETKLNDICKINPENISSSKKYEFINYIDIGSISEGKIKEISKLTNKYPSRAKRIIKKGDTIISTVRPNLKNYSYIHNNIENGVVSTGFCVIRTITNNVIDKYVYYMITSDKVTNYLIRNATGAQYPAVNSSIVSQIKIKVIGIEKQEEIVKYCDNLSNMIENMEQQITKNNDLMKNILENYLNIKTDEKNTISTEESDVLDEDILSEQEIVNSIEDLQEELSDIDDIIEVKPKKKER